MIALCRLIWCGLIRSRASLEIEILALRHQLNILGRKSPKRPMLGRIDRLVFVGLYGLAPDVLSALAIVRPETVIRWHRAGFRLYWRWRSRRPGGRPKVPVDVRQLIRDISIANPLWGAPRIHGELLKLGIDVGQTTVAKYMAREATSEPGMEDVSSQPCGRRRIDGPVCGPDDLVPTAVRTSNSAPWSPRNPVDWSDRASECRMDRSSTH